MSRTIIIEPLKEFSSMGVVEDILLQEEVALVAVGSMACIGGIKHVTELLQATDRVFLHGLSAKEYSLGKNAAIVAKLLNEVVVMPGVKGVIVYCSCLDVLTNWNEEALLAEVCNFKHIPIEFIYRGPLVKRKIMPKKALQLIWEKWGLQEKSLGHNYTKDVSIPVDVDFKTAIEEVEENTDILLLTPGGCASCLYDVNGIKRSNIYNTRFDDLFLATCQVNDFVAVIEAYFSKSKPLLLLGTSVIKTVGIEVEEICNKMLEDGYDVSFIATDGFRQ